MAKKTPTGNKQQIGLKERPFHHLFISINTNWFADTFNDYDFMTFRLFLPSLTMTVPRMVANIHILLLFFSFIEANDLDVDLCYLFFPSLGSCTFFKKMSSNIIYAYVHLLYMVWLLCRFLVSYADISNVINHD